MHRIHLFFAIFALGFAINVTAQEVLDTIDPTVIQFSGVVLSEEDGFMDPLPYVNVHVDGTNRGSFTDSTGFFSLVARKGEKVLFTSVGYVNAEYVIPDSLSSFRYSMFQIMTRDTILLPETVIYPWPSREHFKIEFLAMDVTNELESRAEQNLSDQAIANMMLYLPTDGDENADFYLRQQAQSYYYNGQIRPINVLNAFAWKEFIEAIKRGDFKKKKKKN